MIDTPTLRKSHAGSQLRARVTHQSHSATMGAPMDLGTMTATILRDGGGTFWPTTGEPLQALGGYIVAEIAAPTAVELPARPASTVYATLSAYLERWDVSALLELPGRYVSALVDDDGTLLVDVAQYVADEREARELAAERGVHVWDVEAEHELVAA